MPIEHEERRLQAMITLQIINVPEDNSKNFKLRQEQYKTA